MPRPRAFRELRLLNGSTGDPCLDSHRPGSSVPARVLMPGSIARRVFRNIPYRYHFNTPASFFRHSAAFSGLPQAS